ncbi:MAG: glutamine synthetase III [Simkaniaceae bacterium]
MISREKTLHKDIIKSQADSNALKEPPVNTAQHFGRLVFSRKVMQNMLPPQIFRNIIAAKEGREKINPAYADTIALAMKEWAVSQGATHYCHWFQPLTGAAAEKHDSFLDWKGSEEVIERFFGDELIKGEPDASSFPSGGLRNTYEARGYTGWDPTSPAFLWKSGGTLTLCIPSVFFSWKGEVLDTKIPLIRSDEKIKKAVIRLLKITGIETNHVYSTLGCEQEYFVIDQSFLQKRPDLLLLGKTVFGSAPPKGQELCDHYFGSVKERVLSFMHQLEQEALQLGIPLKTRHNEVAPSQYEVATFFEKSTMAVDHNVLLMQLMKKIAAHHNLSVLLHEKPFANINGSGKHLNWSLMTEEGLNLLNPSEAPQNNIYFLILLAAVLQAIYRHGDLLRASIGSHGNDFRLGGHEAPPSIISVYLGDALEEVVQAILESKELSAKSMEMLNLNIHAIPELPKDNTDRNRTSPFAFTGNKFEFRAMGSSMSPAFPITVINAIVAESLEEILDEIEGSLPDVGPFSEEGLYKAALPILRKVFQQTESIRYSGDNYSLYWQEEAKKRGLGHSNCSFLAYDAMLKKESAKAFENILSTIELQSKCEVLKDSYIKEMGIEIKLMKELFLTQIFPAAVDYQKILAETLLQKKQFNGLTGTKEEKLLQKISLLLDQSLLFAETVSEEISEQDINELKKQLKAWRECVDELESCTDNRRWPLPKYREMLFLL